MFPAGFFSEPASLNRLQRASHEARSAESSPAYPQRQGKEMIGRTIHMAVEYPAKPFRFHCTAHMRTSDRAQSEAVRKNAESWLPAV